MQIVIPLIFVINDVMFNVHLSIFNISYISSFLSIPFFTSFFCCLASWNWNSGSVFVSVTGFIMFLCAMVLSYLNIRIMAQRFFLAHGYKRHPIQVCHFDCHKINWMPVSLSLKTAEQC